MYTAGKAPRHFARGLSAPGHRPPRRHPAFRRTRVRQTMERQMNFVRLDASDNVVTATRALEAGVEVEETTTTGLIPSGHKIATRAIAKGEPVRKYAQLIGLAHEDIAPGDHVHTHNLDFVGTAVDYEFGTDQRPVQPVAESKRDTFMGFRRESGAVGTRNYIAIVTSVNCSATAARRIADAFGPEELAAYPNVDGVVAFVHGTGCGMAGDGEGFEALQRVMWGYARHPNHAGVLMVGLGCEMNQIDWLLEAYGLKQGPTFQVMNIQGVAGLRATIEKGIEKVRAMLPIANEAVREPCPVSELKVALQCGGSDAWSGITANPALGYACDLLAAQGGTGVLAETPEIYGAEHLLTRRAVSRDVGEKLVGLVKWWEDYTARNKGSMDNNPSPGNKKGGLTTILEKSLGAAAKGGTSPLAGVYKYAEPVTAKGFTFMDSPGYDPASVTGQIAGGCNMVVFTTGRGSAFGSKPAPTIKVATNTEMYGRMIEDMDINAGAMLTEGQSLEQKGREIYEKIIAVASGEKSKSEAQGLGDYEFVPWQIGAVM
jgi:altronate hydrolase